MNEYSNEALNKWYSHQSFDTKNINQGQNHEWLKPSLDQTETQRFGVKQSLSADTQEWIYTVCMSKNDIPYNLFKLLCV